MYQLKDYGEQRRTIHVNEVKTSDSNFCYTKVVLLAAVVLNEKDFQSSPPEAIVSLNTEVTGGQLRQCWEAGNNVNISSISITEEQHRTGVK